MMKQLLIFLGLGLPLFLFGQAEFSGFYKPVEDSLIYLEGLTYDSLSIKLEALDEEHFHLMDLDIYTSKDTVRYWAICREGADWDTIQHIVRWDSLIKQKRKMFKEGYVMQDIEHYRDARRRDHYIAYWNKGSALHKVWKFDSREAMNKKITAHAKQDLFLKDVEPVLMYDGSYIFLGIFHREGPRDRTYLYESDNLSTFMEDRRRRLKSGYRMRDFERFYEGDKTVFMAIYEKGTHLDFVQVNMDTAFPDERMMGGRYKDQELKLVDLEIRRKLDGRKKSYKFKFKYNSDDY